MKVDQVRKDDEGFCSGSCPFLGFKGLDLFCLKYSRFLYTGQYDSYSSRTVPCDECEKEN